MEDMLALFIGVGLAAACGFRVFVPLLGIALASATGHLQLSADFAWIGSPVAVAALAVATARELGADYTPWLDNLLDAVAAPAAVVAGIMVTASVTGDMSPFLRWSLAVIAGGGAAAIVQAGTTLLRASSTAATGGLGNPLVASGELVGASAVTASALFVPTLAFGAAVLLCVVVGLKLVQAWRTRTAPPAPRVPPALPHL